MADIELPSASSAGSVTQSSDMMAVQFMESDVTLSSSASGSSSGSTKGLGAESNGVSALTSSVTRGRPLDGGSSLATAISAAMLRRRTMEAASGGASDVQANAGARRGIASAISGKTTTGGVLGRVMPVAGDVASSVVPRSSLETGGVNFQDIYLQVTGTPVFNNDADPTTGNPGTWTVPTTLKRGGVANTRIPTGSAVVKWGEYSATPGTSFTGGILLTSDLANAPYIDVYTVLKNSGGTVFPWHDAALKPRVRMGNLKGVLGKAVDEWGIAMSMDLSDATKPYISASNAGLDIKDANVSVINGSAYFGNAARTTYLEWDGTSLTIKGDGSGITNIDGGNIATGTVTANKINLNGFLDIKTTGGIYQGTGVYNGTVTAVPGGTIGTGLKIFNSGGIGKLETYNTGVKQITLDTDGKLKAGGGVVTLDADGIWIKTPTTLDFQQLDSSFLFTNSSGTVLGGLYSAYMSNGRHMVSLKSDSVANAVSDLEVRCESPVASYIYLDCAVGINNTRIHLSQSAGSQVGFLDLASDYVDVYGSVKVTLSTPSVDFNNKLLIGNTSTDADRHTIRVSTANMIINPRPTGNLYFQYDQGGGTTYFHDGTPAGVLASLSKAGKFSTTKNLSGATYYPIAATNVFDHTTGVGNAVAGSHQINLAGVGGIPSTAVAIAGRIGGNFTVADSNHYVSVRKWGEAGNGIFACVCRSLDPAINHDDSFVVNTTTDGNVAINFEVVGTGCERAYLVVYGYWDYL